MNTLTKIENNSRQATLNHLRSSSVCSLKTAFLVEFIYAPFGILTFMFIPLLGQLLTVICLALGLVYVFLIRSLITLAAGLLGLAVSTTLLSLFFMHLKSSAMVAMYALLGLSVIVSLAYLVLVSGALLHLMQERSSGKPNS